MKTMVLVALLGLSGFVTTKQVLSVPAFQKRYSQVKIDPAPLKGISGKGITVITVFGDWCSDSAEHVPEFVKISRKLGFDDVQWVAVGHHLSDSTGIVRAYHIKRVPTFLFFVNGAEMGRIVEHPKATMEKDTAAIIKAIRKQTGKSN
ncbi:MAG: thioredoxin family protein [Acidobacteria bacterium]|nr:thioredoxin family protein [Acidobacteriota bacterium]